MFPILSGNTSILQIVRGRQLDFASKILKASNSSIVFLNAPLEKWAFGNDAVRCHRVVTRNARKGWNCLHFTMRNMHFTS